MADDPKLIKIARTIAAEQRAAKAAGKTLSDEWIDWYVGKESGGTIPGSAVREYLQNVAPRRHALIGRGSKAQDAGQTSRPDIRDVGRSFAQGLTFNFADELIGKLKGEGAKEEMRLRGDMFAAESPREATMSGIAGGMVPGLLVPGGAVASAATTVPRAVALGAGLSAAGGALAGAGAGETPSERASGALVSGGIGALLGAGIAGAPAAINAFKPSVRATRQLVKEVKSGGGANLMRSKVGQFEALGKGDEVVLGDITPEMRGLADRAATASDAARFRIEAVTRPRQAGMAERMLADAEDELPKIHGEVPNAVARRTQLEESRRAWAGDAYGALRQKYQVMPDVFTSAGPGASRLTPQGAELTKFFVQPKVKGIIKEARDLKLIGSMPDRSANLSFEELQTAREQIRDAIDAAFAGKHGNLGRRLKDVEKELTGHMQQRMPELKTVDTEYARLKALEESLGAGEEAWSKGSLRELEATVARMSKEELQQFQYGLASKYIDKLNDVRTNRDFAAQVLNASKAEQTKMRLAFGPNYSRVIGMAKLEREMAELRGATTGAQTARRHAASDAADDVMAAGTTGLSAGVGMMTSMASRGIARGARARANEATARALAPMLLTEGSDAIDALLKNLRNPSLIGGVAARAPLSAVPVLEGLMNQR